MNWKKLLGFIFIIAGNSISVSAGNFNSGSPAGFLEIGSGARALGMGKAYGAAAEGHDALFWNPAGLGSPYQTGLRMSHVTLFEGASISEFSAAHAFRRPWGLGFSAVQFNMSGATRRDAFNNQLGDITDSSTAFLLGLGAHPWERITIGTTQKIIRRKVDDISASAWDADIGISARFGRFRLGFESQNLLGSKLERDGGYDKLPRTQRIGGAFTAGGFLLSADMVCEENLSPEIRSGLEYDFFNILALRAGYDGNDPTFGGSLSSYGLSLDYAILKHEVLGISHRISLRVGLGAVADQKALARVEWRKGYLAKQIDKNPPIVIISTPANNHETFGKFIDIAGLIQDDTKVERVSLNGRPLDRKRGISVLPKPEKPADFDVKDTFFFSENVPLVAGPNYIVIEARDSSDKISSAQTVVFRKSAEQSAAPIAAKSNLPTLWFVAIGIDKYANENIPTLKYAVKDAAAFHDFFNQQKDMGVYKEVRSRIISDKDVTLGNMRSALGEFFIDAREDDIAIVFFAGHGFVDKLGDAYLLAHDSVLDRLYSTALPMSEFKDLLAHRIPPKRTLVIADACHSGSMGANLRGTSDIIAEFSRMVKGSQGKVILTASREREYSRENDEKAHGVFTYYLLKALKGAADVNPVDGIVTLSEVYDYIFSEVVKNTNGGQHPTLPAGGFDNELPLATVERP